MATHLVNIPVVARSDILGIMRPCRLFCSFLLCICMLCSIRLLTGDCLGLALEEGVYLHFKELRDALHAARSCGREEIPAPSVFKNGAGRLVLQQVFHGA
jgi:hypothetical protein